ncbi:fructose-6-phosphate aldolase [Sebaldella sp. S0638]|uniref:fructose-6-phosphate aldolase n=1 Tax=Sebaldella sp. S0638 TaxID=2957809 RepID=UPI00209EAF79|nr:fructose-6-phosphate aldolase [Sebaldella sp. S0638]MCP1222944.1 fructose-6-phosphate aldolase [Sebaldella sp. S0638]
MEYLLDTANLEEIKYFNEKFPIVGVTTNPTIIANEKGDYKKIINSILEIIGTEKMLHVQVLGRDAETIIKEAGLLKETLKGNLYIKIPVSDEGLKAMAVLKKKGFNITATGILTSQQIVFAAQAGADYMAPYVNRADNIGGDGVRVVSEAYEILSRNKDNKAKILGASYKNVKQVHDSILAGAEAVTVGSDVLKQMIYHPYTDWSIDKFESDWGKVYGNGKNLLDIL